MYMLGNVIRFKCKNCEKEVLLYEVQYRGLTEEDVCSCADCQPEQVIELNSLEKR